MMQARILPSFIGASQCDRVLLVSVLFNLVSAFGPATWLGSEAASANDIRAANFSVRVSTSMVQSSSVAPSSNRLKQDKLASGEPARSEAPRESTSPQQRNREPRYAPLGGQQTSSPIGPQQDLYTYQYHLTAAPHIGLQPFRNDEALEQVRQHDEIARFLGLENSGRTPNAFGKILDQPQYRRSVSTSWQVAPPGDAQEQQSSARKQRQREALPVEAPAANRQVLAGTGGTAKQSAFSALDERNCQRHGLSKMLKSAKSLMTGGFASLEQYATSGGLMLGSGILAAAIPLAAFLLPDSGATTKQRRAGSSASETDETPGGSNGGGPFSMFSLQSRLDSMMGWIERSVEHLPNFPRLHPQECVKRSICEAHNEPSKYGAIGFMLRLFFPASNLSSTDRMDNMEYKVINKYRHAAGFGLNRRLENNGTGLPYACKEKYEDCLVSLLDVAQNLMDLFLK